MTAVATPADASAKNGSCCWRGVEYDDTGRAGWKTLAIRHGSGCNTNSACDGAGSLQDRQRQDSQTLARRARALAASATAATAVAPPRTVLRELLLVACQHYSGGSWSGQQSEAANGSPSRKRSTNEACDGGGNRAKATVRLGNTGLPSMCASGSCDCGDRSYAAKRRTCETTVAWVSPILQCVVPAAKIEELSTIPELNGEHESGRATVVGIVQGQWSNLQHWLAEHAAPAAPATAATAAVPLPTAYARRRSCGPRQYYSGRRTCSGNNVSKLATNPTCNGAQNQACDGGGNRAKANGQTCNTGSPEQHAPARHLRSLPTVVVLLLPGSARAPPVGLLPSSTVDATCNGNNVRSLRRRPQLQRQYKSGV